MKRLLELQMEREHYRSVALSLQRFFGVETLANTLFSEVAIILGELDEEIKWAELEEYNKNVN